VAQTITPERSRTSNTNESNPLTSTPSIAAPHDGYSRAQLVAHLQALGLKTGDTVFVRAAMRAIGPTTTDKADAFIGALFDTIGPGGTLVAPTFTRQYPIWRRDIPFADADTQPSTGTMTSLLLTHPAALRSAHPTHSFVAVGPQAAAIVANHTPLTACFEPLRRVMAIGGKSLLVGCVSESPGFSTVHLAQFDLGLTRRHYLRLAYHVKLRGADGQPTFFSGIESPGCSYGFGRFYSDYVIDENFNLGRVGDAWSISVDAARAYAVEHARLAADPTYAHCTRATCVRCRILSGYNLWAAPAAILRNVVTRGPRLARRILARQAAKRRRSGAPKAGE